MLPCSGVGLEATHNALNRFYYPRRRGYFANPRDQALSTVTEIGHGNVDNYVENLWTGLCAQVMSTNRV